MDSPDANRHSPRLPPEIVYEVLANLGDCNNHKKAEVLLDFMAASMVCHEWYHVARGFITEERISAPFRFGWMSILSETPHRFAALLRASRDLNLPYCAEVKCFTDIIIDEDPSGFRALTWEKVPPENHAALLAIMQLTKLKKLKLRLDPRFAQSSPERIRAREYLLRGLTERCPGIPSLLLHFRERYLGLSPRPDDPCLADLIRAMAPSLTTVVIAGEPDLLTAAALATLDLRSASFAWVSVRMVNAIVCNQRDLREVRLFNLTGPGTESLFARLGDVLEEITVGLRSLQSVPHESEPLQLAFESLVSRNKGLRILKISSTMTDSTLRAVARHCRDLEEISIKNCLDMTGVGVWDNATTPWPKLRRLHMANVGIVTEFVEQVVAACDALEHLALGERLSRDNRLVGVLEWHGFERHGESWDRKR
ncbi:hypothetical protein BC936DRAFT_143843 [Jimgerdemannia flammicorona]|nr:hypothetical protein BC936DRAFT_143843 [Jimgerdemannia flammicorona]